MSLFPEAYFRAEGPRRKNKGVASLKVLSFLITQGEGPVRRGRGVVWSPQSGLNDLAPMRHGTVTPSPGARARLKRTSFT